MPGFEARLIVTVTAKKEKYDIDSKMGWKSPSGLALLLAALEQILTEGRKTFREMSGGKDPTAYLASHGDLFVSSSPLNKGKSVESSSAWCPNCLEKMQVVKLKEGGYRLLCPDCGAEVQGNWIEELWKKEKEKEEERR